MKTRYKNCNNFKDVSSVPTSEKTQSLSITKTNLLMEFREIVGIYCENYMKHIEVDKIQSFSM